MVKRGKPHRYHTSTLMKRMGLNLAEESVANIAATDPNFLFSADSKFNLDIFKDSPQEIVCPKNQSGVLNLLKYMQNVHLALDTLEVNRTTAEAVDNLKRSLVILLIHGNDLIGERVYLEDYSTTEVDENDPKIVHDFDVFLGVDTVIFEVILRCCVFLQHFYNFSDVTCARDFPYVIDNLLIPSELDEVPIFEYNILEVLSCFNIVSWDWHKLRYDDQLILYLDTLLARFAILAFIPSLRKDIPDEMFNAYSILLPVPEAAEESYLPSIGVVRDLCWTYQSMWKKAELCAHINSHRGEEDLTQIPIFTEQQKDLVRKRIFPCDVDGTCKDDFRNFVLQSLIRPGERQHYLSTKPNASTRVDLVIRSRPGDERLADKWMEHLALDTSQIGQDPNCFDECVRDWALIELAQLYIKSEACVETTRSYFWNYFDLIDLEDALESQLNREYPMILQNFNWYGVYYKTRFYSHEDAASAILHWLYIVWENSLPLEGVKFFPPASIVNLQLKAYNFGECRFRPVE